MVVAGADAAPVFEPAEDVLHSVALAIELAIMSDGLLAI